MALFRDRQEYLETRKLFHDGQLQAELSQWGRRRRRNKENRHANTLVRMVTGTKDGDSLCKLAKAQSLQMRLLKARFQSIKDDQVYEIKEADLRGVMQEIVRQVLAEVFGSK